MPHFVLVDIVHTSFVYLCARLSRLLTCRTALECIAFYELFISCIPIVVKRVKTITILFILLQDSLSSSPTRNQGLREFGDRAADFPAIRLTGDEGSFILYRVRIRILAVS